MALEPLATVDDLEAHGVTVDESETALATTYLGVASAAIRDAAGCPISQLTSTIVIEGGPGAWLSLPGGIVTAVAEVKLDGEAIADWRLVAGRLWRARGWATSCEPGDVEVTQTHGLAVLPADLVSLVCRMAAAALAAYRSEDGGEGLAARDVRAERIGDYSVTYGDDGLITEMELPDYLRERLRARFGAGGAMLVRAR